MCGFLRIGGWQWVGPQRFSANKCKHHPKQRFTAAAAASLLPQQVEHHRLQVVAEGAHSRHQPVRAETGVRVHHTLGHVHLRQKTNTVRQHRKQNLRRALVLVLAPPPALHTLCRGVWIRTRKFCFQSQISSKCIRHRRPNTIHISLYFRPVMWVSVQLEGPISCFMDI